MAESYEKQKQFITGSSSKGGKELAGWFRTPGGPLQYLNGAQVTGLTPVAGGTVEMKQGKLNPNGESAAAQVAAMLTRFVEKSI